MASLLASSYFLGGGALTIMSSILYSYVYVDKSIEESIESDLEIKPTLTPHTMAVLPKNKRPKTGK